MSTALFGGTFDPIHTAHLIIGQEAVERLRLDRLVFVPAARPPHKPDSRITDPAHRLEMVRLAIAGDRRFEVSSLEADRGGRSYTIETIRLFRRRLAEGEKLFFIVGADSLAQFLTWKDPENLLSECEFVVAPRPGVDLDEADPGVRARMSTLDAPSLEISSSDIRARVRSGRSIRYLVPEAVESYIREKSLYT
mgnify:CR=1 FL=1